jgi:flagellar biosynthetic protein FliP
MMHKWIRWALPTAVFLLLPALAFGQDAAGQGSMPTMADAMADVMGSAGEDEVNTSIRLLIMLTSLTFLPAIILIMTPFTRFVIVLSLLRQAMGLQQAPPNQVLIGLAMVMSMMVMHPVLTEVYEGAVEPYMEGEMETGIAYTKAMKPLRRFMFRNMGREDLGAVIKISKIDPPATIDDIPSTVVISSFVLSEIKKAFVMAVKVYIPFLVVDIVVASVLLGMGMMMIPPVVISLPFKLLVFVLMDGWSLLISGMVGGFN